MKKGGSGHEELLVYGTSVSLEVVVPYKTLCQTNRWSDRKDPQGLYLTRRLPSHKGERYVQIQKVTRLRLEKFTYSRTYWEPRVIDIMVDGSRPLRVTRTREPGSPGKGWTKVGPLRFPSVVSSFLCLHTLPGTRRLTSLNSWSTSPLSWLTVSSRGDWDFRILKILFFLWR